MKKKLIVLFLASASLGAFAQTAKPYVSQVWNRTMVTELIPIL